MPQQGKTLSNLMLLALAEVFMGLFPPNILCCFVTSRMPVASPGFTHYLHL